MSDFRPEDRPAQPRIPNAVCRPCGWLREIRWAAEPPPCPNCGDRRVDRITGRTLFLCRRCAGQRLEYAAPCPVCRADAPPAETAPAPMARIPAPGDRARSGRRVKNFLHVTFAATVEASIDTAATADSDMEKSPRPEPGARSSGKE